MKVFENIVGKAENVGNQHLNLLYFPKYFHAPSWVGG